MKLTNMILTKFTTKIVSFFVGNINGLNNLKFIGPRIIIANHSSYMDHFVILYLLKKQNPKQSVYFLTKKEAFEKPFSRWWHVSLNSILVDRGKNALSSMMTLKDKLIHENAVVVVYPEGTRTPTGNMYFGKSGAESLAYATGVQIIPIGMHGNFDVLPKFTKFPKMKKINVNIGTDITINKSARKDITNISVSHIRLLSELSHEQLEAKPIDLINVKKEMLKSMVKNNQKALRNYPSANHTPTEYHNRVLYTGRIILSRFEISVEDRNLILLEIGRAYGRLAYISGVKTLKGRYYMMKTTNVLRHAEKNAEWYYIKGHQLLFLGQKEKYLNYLIKANKMESNNNQYMLALAKAKIGNSDFGSARTTLLSVLKKNSISQLDARRHYEAIVMLMRMDSQFYPNQEAMKSE